MAADGGGRITIFSTSTCQYCRAAKSVVTNLGFHFIDIDFDKYPDRRHELYSKIEARTVPQIFFNDKYVGGFDELDHLNKSGILKQSLSGIMSTSFPIDSEWSTVLRLPETRRNESKDSIGGEQKEEGKVDFVSELSWGEPLELTLLRDLSQKMRQHVNVDDKRNYLFWVHRCVFRAKEAVDFVSSELEGERAMAVTLCSNMHKAKLIHPVTPDNIFHDGNDLWRFQEDISTRSLNKFRVYQGPPRPAEALGETLRTQILSLFNDYLSDDGLRVDYAGIAQSKNLEEFALTTCQLQNTEVKGLERNTSLAFFINVYNALIVHAHATKPRPSSNLQRALFFDTISYTIGGMELSLNDIENGILRGNRKAPYHIRLHFQRGDPRTVLSLNPPEPRVHFALVCGAKSCPPIKVYRASNVNEALTLAAEAFVNNERNCSIDVESHSVTLSQIFSWYHVDFGADDDEMLTTLLQWLSPSRRHLLQMMLHNHRQKVTVRYFPYDWSLND